MHQTTFPAHQKEYVFVLTPIGKCDQEDEEVPNDFNLGTASGERQSLLVNKDDGVFGEGMRPAG